MAPPRDPGHFMLSRGIRTAVAVPLAYLLLANVLHMPDGSTQACYAAYSQLAMANFAGSAKQRATAYSLVGLVGLPLVVLGWAISGTTALAVVIMAVFAVGVSFAGLLRGNTGQAVAALLMPLILAVTGSSAGSANLIQQLVGFAIGSLLSLAAALAIWPTNSEALMRSSVARSLRTLAQRISIDWKPEVDWSANIGGRQGGPRTDGYGPTVGEYSARPGLTSARNRALILATDEVDFLKQLVATADPPVAPGIADQRLATVTVATLRSTADNLAAGTGSIPIDLLDTAREEQLAELTELWTSSVPLSAADLSSRFRLRAIALSSEAIAAFAVAASGRHSAAAADPKLAGSALHGARRHVSGRERVLHEIASGGPWLRNSVRAALAITAATLLVLLTDLSHGYWVVLGTLTALRFDSLGTRRNGLQMIFGTVAGFAVGCLVVVLASDDPAVLWLIFILTSFLAAYTPRVIALWVGQGSFAVLSVAIFALSTPHNFSAAEFRLIDVAIAVVVSLAVAALVWPHGVRQIADRTLIAAAEAAGAQLVSAVAFAVDRSAGESERPGTQRAVDVLDNAGEAYDLAASQGVPKLTPPQTWALMTNVLAAANHSSDMIIAVRRHFGALPNHDGQSAAFLAQAGQVAHALPQLVASRVRPDLVRQPGAAEPAPPEAPASLLTGLIENRFADTDTKDARLTQPLWLAERLVFVEQLVKRLARPPTRN